MRESAPSTLASVLPRFPQLAEAKGSAIDRTPELIEFLFSASELYAWRKCPLRCAQLSKSPIASRQRSFDPLPLARVEVPNQFGSPSGPLLHLGEQCPESV